MYYIALHCSLSALESVMGVTTVRLQPDLEESLEAVAAKLQRSKSWLINQALREYIAREQEESARWQETLTALESVRAGRVVDAEGVHDWLRSWGTPKESGGPKGAK
jgi:predicted transcriptional regulator